MKINNVIWFTAGIDTIGIVLCTNEMGEKKAYMKIASGTDEEADTKLILEHGARIHDHQAKIIHNHFND